MQDFRNLQVWGKAHRLALEIHRLTESFPTRERYGLTDQLRRASRSIPANIVEGSGRGSDRDTARMLRIGLASAAELHYHLIFSQDIGLISTPEFKMLEERVVEVKRMLSGFIRRLKADG